MRSCCAPGSEFALIKAGVGQTRTKKARSVDHSPFQIALWPPSRTCASQAIVPVRHLTHGRTTDGYYQPVHHPQNKLKLQQISCLRCAPKIPAAPTRATSRISVPLSASAPRSNFAPSPAAMCWLGVRPYLPLHPVAPRAFTITQLVSRFWLSLASANCSQLRQVFWWRLEVLK